MYSSTWIDDVVTNGVATDDVANSGGPAVWFVWESESREPLYGR